MGDLPKLYIIVPCYNEEEALPLSAPVFARKLEQLSGGSQTSSSLTNLFSSHPETKKRIEHISQRCLNDGYNRPTTK